MVDASVLSSDILQTVAYLALLPLLWLLLFLIAWDDRATAEASGFTRRVFWLLLPGALLGEITYLPIFYWNGNVLTVDIGGGIVPILLSTVLVTRAFGDRTRFLALFLATFAAVCGLLYAGILVPFPPTWFLLWAVGVTMVPPVFLLAASRGSEPALATTLVRVAQLLILSGFALLVTYYTTATVPGYGIVSTFPWYLLAPIGLGIVVVLLAPPVLRLSREVALGVAFAGTTFGVLIGADLLREPPLYATSGQLFSIGGAGVGDLLYLSPMLALASGYLTLRVIRWREGGAAPTTAPPAPSSGALLRRGLRLAISGDGPQAVSQSAAAVRTAAAQTRRLLAIPDPVANAAPLAGLPAPAWMTADSANLEALARQPTVDARDGTRAWFTARWLVRFAREVGRQRFGSFRGRGAAFAIDLALLTGPMFLVWYAVIALSGSGNAVTAVSGVVLNAVTFGYIAVGLLYFVILESYGGATLGKWFVGLEVTDRELARPGLLAALVRNLPKLIPLTILGLVGAYVVAFLVFGSPYSVGVGGVAAFLDVGASILLLLAIAILGVGLPAAISAVCMSVSAENQRLGDWFAGTWVVRRGPTAPAAPTGPVSVPSG